MLEFQTSDVLAVVFFIASGATTLIVALEKLKKKAYESSLIEKISEKVDAQITEVKSEFSLEFNKINILYNSLSDKIIEADKRNAVVDDRVKGIFLKLGEFSAETSKSLQKMEDNLKEEIKSIAVNFKGDMKERREECKEQGTELKKLIERIEDKK